jgi:hypothetical protein
LSRRFWGGVFFPMHYSVRAGLWKGIKKGKLKTGKWDVVLYSCLQSSCLPWFLGCGFAALCLLRLFAAERLSPPVPSDGTCPLHAGGVIDASLSGGCPPEFVVRRPGVSPPPPTNLPSKRWRDLILRVWRVDPLPCPSSLGGDLNSSFILHHFRQASSGPVCHGIALLLAHCLAARPLPPAYGLGDGAKPPENRQNLPVVPLHQLCQDGAGMNESEKQFSFTRVVSSTSGRAKNPIPISLVPRQLEWGR